jgi:hypothetical protein
MFRDSKKKAGPHTHRTCHRLGGLCGLYKRLLEFFIPEIGLRVHSFSSLLGIDDHEPWLLEY